MTSPSALRLLPWSEIALPLARAEDALVRLDERLRRSPIRDGWIARTHFADACAALLLKGQLVHIEDLVLHDAGMDVRTPTHELTRAHAVLAARRRIAGAEPGWALSTRPSRMPTRPSPANGAPRPQPPASLIRSSTTSTGTRMRASPNGA